MRLSEAMALGSTILKPLAGVLRDGNGRGCAWGMVQEACPSGWQALDAQARRTYVMALPCGCTGMVMSGGCQLAFSGRIMTIAFVIVHVFNQHVATTKDWTMERLIDWVRSVEPVPDEGKEVVAAPVEEAQECTVAHS